MFVGHDFRRCPQKQEPPEPLGLPLSAFFSAKFGVIDLSMSAGCRAVCSGPVETLCNVGRLA